MSSNEDGRETKDYKEASDEMLDEVFGDDPGDYKDQKFMKLELPETMEAQYEGRKARRSGSSGKRKKVKKANSRFRTTEERKRRDRTEQINSMLSQGRSPLGFAADNSRIVEEFEAKKLNKPGWAVIGCVLLRDMGNCRVCGKSIKTWKTGEWSVVQLKRHIDGGQFDETNAILVCGECSTCWDSTRNFYYVDSFREGFILQRNHVLNRRRKNFHGCRALSLEEMEVGKLVRREADEVKYSRKVESQLGGSPDAKAIFDKWLAEGDGKSLEEWFEEHGVG